MKPFPILLLSVVVLTLSGCSKSERAVRATLEIAMRNARLDSASDITHREGGLREQVDEIFFRANPVELKEAISMAGFVRDDTVPASIRSATSFKELVGGLDQAAAIGFRRVDLTPREGKSCRLLCAEDFAWAYVIYVDYGKS